MSRGKKNGKKAWSRYKDYCAGWIKWLRRKGTKRPEKKVRFSCP